MLKSVDNRKFWGHKWGNKVFDGGLFPHMACSDAEILALLPKEKPYKHSFGEGLYILVHPDGRKYWRLKYRFGGRERSFSIGVFPDVAFAAAVASKKAARGLLRQGIDPNEAKREAAKSKDRKPSGKIFQLSLSASGALTLETSTKLLNLTSSQTNALRSFLGVELISKGGDDDT